MRRHLLNEAGGKRENVVRLGIFQRIVPEYRVPVFARLASEHGMDLTIYTTNFDSTLASPPAVKVRELRIGGAALHPTILSAAHPDHHDVFVCEGAVTQLTSDLLVIGQGHHRVPVVWWTSLWQP